MKFLSAIIIALLALTGCVSTNNVILDKSKRPRTEAVEIIEIGQSINRKLKEIAELAYLGDREDEYDARRHFVKEAKKLGAHAIVLKEPEYTTFTAYPQFQPQAWVFKAKAIVYEE